MNKVNSSLASLMAGIQFFFRLSIFVMVFGLRLTAQTYNDSITHDGITRTYIVHVPPYLSPSDTLPLVFSLHGLVMTAQWQSDLSQFNPIADQERFIVVYPQGLPNSTGQNSWNTFSSPYHSGVDDVGFLSALIDTLYRDYHIDLKRVYSCGMSNGGFMSYRLACELDDRIAAIASVTGCMTDSMAFYCHPSRPFPVLHFHGTADPIVAYGGGGAIKSVDASLQYWIQNNNCPADAEETPLPNTNTTDSTTVTRLYPGLCDSLTEVIHYRVNNGGHTWPGSDEDFFGVGGNINLDIMASEIIWEFFKQYPRIVSSVEELSGGENSSIKVYPNPAEDFVNVSSNNNERLQRITINDLSGKTVISRSLKGSSSETLSIANLPQGMYFLACETAQVRKIFKVFRR